jgi:hypothetical protein
MKKPPLAIGARLALALSLLAGSPLLGGAAMAQDTTGTAKPITSGSVKPHLGNGPAVEKSLPSSAPAATTKQTTGATNQSKTVKTMNSNEKSKLEAEGK